MADPGAANPRAYDLHAKDGVLTIVMHREFDRANTPQDWAIQVQVLHPGPFTQVVVDCSGCGLLSSSFFSGLMQLHRHYCAPVGRKLVLHRPDPRMLRNLEVMRLREFFEVVAR